MSKPVVSKPKWLRNPWQQNPWFESVAVAQSRARKRLPAPVYGALVAGSERGQTIAENEAAFREIGFAPLVAGQRLSGRRRPACWDRRSHYQ